MSAKRFVLSVVALTVLGTALTARAGEDDEKSTVTASLLADAVAVVPGESFMLGLRLVMKPHWHTYWINPGESGAPTTIKLTGPVGFEFGEIEWPLPIRMEYDNTVTFGYENEVLLVVPVKVSTSTSLGQATIDADVTWVSCHKDVCLNGGTKLSLKLDVTRDAKPANQSLFTTWRDRLPMTHAGGITVKQQGAQLHIDWAQAPVNVEWFPVATRAVSIDDIHVQHRHAATEIGFKPTVYKPDLLPTGSIDSLIVYVDATNTRRGVWQPVRVLP